MDEAKKECAYFELDENGSAEDADTLNKVADDVNDGCSDVDIVG